MSSDWVKVYTVGKMFNADLIKGMLEENGIECSIMNQQDSELLFGDIEIYVQNKDEIAAKKLINEHNQPE